MIDRQHPVTLPAERIKAALLTVTAWRLDPAAAASCPLCGKDGLQVSDHSTRPIAEWYALKCKYCGLDHMLHIPLAPPGLHGHD